MPKYFIPSDDDAADERCFEVETLEEGRYRVRTPEGDELVVDAYAPEAGRLHFLVGGQSYDADVRPDDGGYTVQVRGEAHELSVLNERQRRMRIAGVGARAVGGPDLTSPMAGKVVAIHAAEGDTVDEGDHVIVIEAMKMENDLKAHIPGTVRQVAVAVGDAVEIGDVLLSIEQ